MIYFDHNASSPLLPEARQAWVTASEQFTGNPSSRHRPGQRADKAISDAREKLAAILQCQPLDIIWTSGATEANNAALHHFAKALDSSAEVWISSIEHPSILAAAKSWFASRVKLIPVAGNGLIDLAWIQANLKTSRPGFIAVLAANNETGVIQPWREISALCRENEVPFFCDATQSIGKLPAAGLGDCDLLSGSAHKFGGPRGVGFLKVPRIGKFHALLHGGMQEEGRRAGTENAPGILGMLAALESRDSQLKSGGANIRATWKEHFESHLIQELPGTEIIGANAPRLWNTTLAVMPPLDSCDSQQRWVVKLDKAGFAVSTGSACASGREEPSHVLCAMGLSPAHAGRVLRFSSGWETTEQDWSALLATLRKIHSDLLRPGQKS